MKLLGYRTRIAQVNGKDCLNCRCFFAKDLGKDGEGVYPCLTADLPLNFDISYLRVGADYIVESFDYTYTKQSTGEIFTFKKISDIQLKGGK